MTAPDPREALAAVENFLSAYMRQEQLGLSEAVAALPALRAALERAEAIEANVFAKCADRLAWARYLSSPPDIAGSEALRALDALLVEHENEKQRVAHWRRENSSNMNRREEDRAAAYARGLEDAKRTVGGIELTGCSGPQGEAYAFGWDSCKSVALGALRALSAGQPQEGGA